MRFLILTTSHGLRDGDDLMTNELVQALKESGHIADVVLLDWAMRASGAVGIQSGSHGEEVLVVPAATPRRLPTIAQRVVKWWATPRRGVKAFNRHFAGRSYDAVIAGTPAMLFRPLLRRVLGTKNAPVSILFIHDFFPIHHAEIGLVPRRAEKLLKRAEEKTMSMFDIIYCNLPTNIAYLQRNYRLSGERILSWMPLWTRTTRLSHPPKVEMRRRYDLPIDRPIAVFGGQIIEGRGIEDMLAAAALADRSGSDTLFLFVGAGRLTPLVEAHASRAGGNVRWIRQVPRSDYLNLVSACDVGMVATVPGVSSHSFPTKTMDYLRVGIPAVVAVEPDSSLAAMVTDAGVAFSVPFGDVPAFLGAVERAAHDEVFRASVAEAARRFLEDVLDVSHVPGRIACDMQRHLAEKRKELSS